ncbi:hypothetical protein SAMD00019534_061050 [Acytostelium subglobosum LB1]|uniref:hypothetical protein n=1 Tax=Acytostelium subglobosum LB1 TaxID=1410327 RepID=UPI000644E5EE|nr:hypothetical protein SAMD00019534_061050 [Acytostelium subglobosum LB1]GAM22930.1 hypothetical protein SAMD00019534_061050 [Acytostelium subglobosum LB1]|eukprot:XP_012754157.1 hypothetical protein SAMD00019534_061050 [Acytostelium subglobosum LB1]
MDYHSLHSEGSAPAPSTMSTPSTSSLYPPTHPSRLMNQMMSYPSPYGQYPSHPVYDAQPTDRPNQLANTAPPNKVLGLFGLSHTTDKYMIQNEFMKYGSLDNVHLIMDRKTNRSKCYAFVYFTNLEDAVKAKNACQDLVLDGKKIRTDYSASSKPHDTSAGGSNPGGVRYSPYGNRDNVRPQQYAYGTYDRYRQQAPPPPPPPYGGAEYRPPLLDRPLDRYGLPYGSAVSNEVRPADRPADRQTDRFGQGVIGTSTNRDTQQPPRSLERPSGDDDRSQQYRRDDSNGSNSKPGEDKFNESRYTSSNSNSNNRNGNNSVRPDNSYSGSVIVAPPSIRRPYES